MVLWISLVEMSVLPAELIGLHGTVFLKLGEETDGFVKTAGAILVFILPGLAAILGELVITDLQGNVVLRRDNVAASPEWPITQVEFGDIASGTLAAALITPHGVGRITILKLP
jgi:hypothetical protein